jgi:hypothetical protein
MAYIFNHIANTAQKHLAPRYQKGLEPFITNTEIISYLTEIFKNPFKAQDAYINFCKLIIKEDETFLDFYTRFFYLINLGRIPTANH